MLIPLLATVAAVSCARGAGPLVWEREAVMADTAQDPNPYRLPFSREEYVAAQSLVRSREEAEKRAGPLFTRDSKVIGVTVMDGDYVLLALVSDELAQRMVAARPWLAELIRWTRANREETLRSLRGDVEAPDG
jgi:hypothetical protein